MSKKKRNNIPEPKLNESAENTAAIEVQAEEAVQDNSQASAEKAADEPAVESVEKIAPEKAVKNNEEKPSKKRKKNAPAVEITKIKVISEESVKKTGEQIKKALGEALDENAEDLDHPESNTAASSESKLSLKQVSSSVFGFFVLIFAIFGIISTVARVTDYVQSLSDDTELTESFLDTVKPLVASDASVFEDAATISEDVLITAACWDIIFNPSESYIADGGSYTVSFLDIDQRIANLFGAGLTYSHKTVGDEELLFEFDEDTGMYSIPAYPKSPAYVPKLAEYESTADGYRVRIAYALPITNLIDSEVTADKVMIFTLKPSGSGYIISALELGELITGQEL